VFDVRLPMGWRVGAPRATPLGAAIGAAQARGTRRALEQGIFGTGDPNRIAAMVGGFCFRFLGAAVERYEFFSSSAQSVHGVRLTDGRGVVLKVARRCAGDESFLRAVQAVQQHLSASGFPCPRPLLEPTALRGGIAVAEELQDCGARADGHDPGTRRAMARRLAEQIRLSRGFADVPGLGPPLLATPPPEDLWPPPHDDRFDFGMSAGGAGWIDDLATEARARVVAGVAGVGDDAVVAHSDWRAEHVRLAGGEVVATYDWQSLALGAEPALVGQIAHAFTMDLGVEQARRRPTLGDYRGFVADYESARGRPFTREEHRTIDAAWVYALAYGARCELADAAADLPAGRPDPAEDSFAALLAHHGPELLR
jgi:hypothetical protein